MRKLLLSFAILLISNSSFAFTNAAGISAINKIIQGAGTYISGSAGAIAQQAIATASGKPAIVTVTAASAIASSRMAGIAATALKGASILGLAQLVIPWLMDEAGIKVCPPPDFFCKTITSDSTNFSGWTLWHKSGLGTQSDAVQACVDYFTNQGFSGMYSISSNLQGLYTLNIIVGRINSYGDVSTFTCTSTRTTVPDTTTTTRPATDPEIAGAIGGAVDKDSAKGPKLYDNLVAGGKAPELHLPGDPVIVSAPPVVLPDVVTTTKVQKPDGSDDTIVKTTKTTVTPQVSNSDLTNTTITYNDTSTTTTTTTNNVTNITNTTTEIKTDTATPDPAKDPKIEFPTDYNREATQQQVLQALKDVAWCKDHPDLNACRNSTISGLCKEITCVGDAIFCSVAQQSAEANCRAVRDRIELEATDAYKLAIQAVAAPLPGAPSKSNGEFISMPSFDSGGFIGGGSCFSDKTVSVSGHSIVLPFSKVCDYLVSLRYALMICAMLLSMKIVSGSIIRGV